MSVASMVRVLRQALLDSAQPLSPVIPGPASLGALEELEVVLGHPVPDDLRELWSVSCEGWWTLIDELFSPEYAAEMTELWREILGEWPIADDVPIHGFVAFASPSGVEILFLVDGPKAGAIVRVDPQDARNPTILAHSLEAYLASETALVRSRGVDAVSVPGTGEQMPLLRPKTT